ncbi:DUF1573 domain-containing protein [Luteolibacter arcticus]|uniref:DUF1573 domain-containing protein n=1 Tax=Luteolibacter arcticus TaxID=1581411 RepID=A0ABT3GMG1_9BACT|nr:DUF1573 domain-containing protein [Luteolibacter arcticus]MCW1924656.1 DUF1573 domain-containing protein [Luteolibacter arcticus]
MRALLICWFACCLPLVAATLKFDETTKEVTIGDDQKTATVDFPFKNGSASDVVIEKHAADCPCAAVGVKDSKLAYKPGESGTIRIVFDLGKVPETVDKFVSIYLKGDREDHPSIKLTTRIIIPVLVELEPKSVIWEVGDNPEPKTVTVTMNGSEPIKLLPLSGTDSRFKREQKTIVEGKKYEIVITPLSTEKPGMGVLQVETDAASDRRPSRPVYMLVRQPAPTPGQVAPAAK